MKEKEYEKIKLAVLQHYDIVDNMIRDIEENFKDKYFHKLEESSGRKYYRINSIAINEIKEEYRERFYEKDFMGKEFINEFNTQLSSIDEQNIVLDDLFETAWEALLKETWTVDGKYVTFLKAKLIYG